MKYKITGPIWFAIIDNTPNNHLVYNLKSSYFHYTTISTTKIQRLLGNATGTQQCSRNTI